MTCFFSMSLGVSLFLFTYIGLPYAEGWCVHLAKVVINIVGDAIIGHIDRERGHLL